MFLTRFSWIRGWRLELNLGPCARGEALHDQSDSDPMPPNGERVAQAARPVRVPAACGQCGEEAPLARGRCPRCGVARDVVAVRREERRAAALAVVGDSWYEWVSEGLGVACVSLVAFGVLPAWALVFAALVLLRPLSRLAMLAARAALDG